MRQVIDPQLQFGEQDISAIELDFKSRDDIPRILRGLQYIYTTAEVREQVFAILEEVLPERVDAGGKVSADTGRPGMEQWKILVLGTLRLGLNADYDRIQELANQHGTIRQMLGHGDGRPTTRSTACRRSRRTCACSPPRSSTASTKWWSAPGTAW